MRELYRRLPSLAGLVAFEAAGRHANFSRAAEELHVTQAAVSRQIRALEERLGATLFQRLHRSVALTDAGERLHRAVTHGFDHMADAIAEIDRVKGENHVGVAANQAVAFYWLRQRVTAYRREDPGADLAVYSADNEPEFGGEGIDVAIRYGAGDWPDATVTLLFDETLFPVCSPRYAESLQRLENPSDLLDTTLLYMDPQGPDWVTWSEWLRAQDVDPGGRLPQGPMFNSYPVLLEAAVEGQGVALGTGRLLDHLLADGALVRPMDAEFRTGRGYYLALPARREPRARSRAFHDWLLTTV